MSRLLAASCAVLILSAACTDGPSRAAPGSSGIPEGVVCEWAEVVRVVDGDTLRVRIDGVEERVRLIGVDTPEMASDERAAEPLAEDAKAYLEELVADGSVCLERDASERDRYERLLRYAWLSDGQMVSEALVAAGLGRVVTFPPDVKYHEARLLPAEHEAAAAQRGIWSE